MPARNRVPSFQIASGTTAERDNSYNIPTGSIFFNTDTSNIELSGNVVVAGDISSNGLSTFTDASFQNDVEIEKNLIVRGDISATNVVADDISVVNKITFPDGSTQTAAAGSGSEVTGLTYGVGGTTNLVLTQSVGAEKTVSIPSGAAEVSFMAYWDDTDVFPTTPQQTYIPTHSSSNVGSPTGYGWDLTTGEFECHTNTAGLYYFCFNVEMSGSSSVNYLKVQAQKNNEDVDIGGFQGGGHNQATQISVAGVIRLAHNDTFRFIKPSGYPTHIVGQAKSRIFGFRINE